MAHRFQMMRRATAAEWSSENPVLFLGEIGYATDTGEWKVGNGLTAFNDLTTGFASGSFVPTFSNPFNLASGPALVHAHYVRVGDVVHVTGRITVEANDGTGSSFLMTVPVPTTLTQAAGVHTFAGGFSNGEVVAVSAANVIVVFIGSQFLTGDIMFSYSYKIG